MKSVYEYIKNWYYVPVQNVDNTKFNIYNKLMFIIENDLILEFKKIICNYDVSNIAELKNAERSLLHYAACNGSILILHQLIEEYNLDILAQDIDGNTPIHLSLMNHKIDCSQYLIMKAKKDNRDIYIYNKSGNSPLHYACNDIQLLKMFESISINIDQENQEGCTALQIAIKSNNYNIIEKLINMGADINKFSCGYTPLLHAFMHNADIHLIELLIKHGADIDNVIKDESFLKSNIIFLAARYNRHELIQILKSEDKEIDVNTRVCGEAPLHTATVYSSLNSVKVLLEYGARIDEPCLFGTPLQISLYLGNYEMTKLLISNGANAVNSVEHGYYRGLSPIHLAIIGKCIDIVKFLTEQFNINENLTIPEGLYHGQSSLSLAKKSHHDTIFQYLKDRYKSEDLTEENHEFSFINLNYESSFSDTDFNFSTDLSGADNA